MQIRQETYEYPLAGGKIFKTTVPVITLDNGFSMQRSKATQGATIETFLCKCESGEFEFEATRRDLPEELPTETYTVLLYSNYIEHDLKLAYEHALDIEQALLNYPPHIEFNNSKPKEVIFAIGKLDDFKRVSAVELHHG